MRRFSILLVVSLLAVSGLMAAMAMSHATVENEADLEIVSTDEALIGLEPGEGIANKEGTAEVNDGNLEFEFGVGEDGEMFGLQKNSEYIWNQLFTVRNNTDKHIRQSLGSENVPEGVSIYIKRGDDWASERGKEIDEDDWKDITNEEKVWDEHGSSANNYPYHLRITVDDDAEMKFSDDMEIYVHADEKDN